MNITMLVLNNFTNDARVHKEATSLASAGHKVSVVSLWQPGLGQVEYQSNYQVIRLRLLSRTWQNRLLSPPIKYLEFAWRVWQFAGREPAHVYHANDANTLPAAWLAAKRNQARLVYDAHELETGRNFLGSHIASVYRAIWSFPEKIFIRKAQFVITVSRSIANELVRLYNIAMPTLVLNCPETKTVSSSNRLHIELKIPEDHKIILYQGRISMGRGIESFIKAIQNIDNVAGVILGEGPALESFRQRVDSGEFQRIYLPGNVSLMDLPSYTASSDLGIVLIEDTCLSYRLSLPNKLFEYLHAGLPVICSDLPEIAQVVRDYQVGELTDPDDPAAIAGNIDNILSDPIRYAQLKANAAKASEEFNWQNESKKLLMIYTMLNHA